MDELTLTGNSFSSSDLTGTTDRDALTGNATVTAFLPPSVFQSITNHSQVGTVFVVYDTGVLFPITSGQERNSSVSTVVGSAVIGIHIGLGLRFSGLVDPVRIMLQVKQQEVGIGNVCEQRIQEDMQCIGVYIDILYGVHAVADSKRGGSRRNEGKLTGPHVHQLLSVLALFVALNTLR